MVLYFILAKIVTELIKGIFVKFVLLVNMFKYRVFVYEMFGPAIDIFHFFLLRVIVCYRCKYHLRCFDF